jgi:hypothetical protein
MRVDIFTPSVAPNISPKSIVFEVDGLDDIPNLRKVVEDALGHRWYFMSWPNLEVEE